VFTHYLDRSGAAGGSGGVDVEWRIEFAAGADRGAAAECRAAGDHRGLLKRLVNAAEQLSAEKRDHAMSEALAAHTIDAKRGCTAGWHW